MAKNVKKANINLRFNIITILVYIIAIILIAQLFNLQILNGDKYRQESNTRLSRESKLEATRGNIVDRTGNVLVTSNMTFNLELYKTKVDDNTLNTAILNMIQILEKYDVKYVDSFPIDINNFQYTISDETLSKWKTSNKVDENATAEQAFYQFKKKYSIQNDNINEVRKIISVRYEITKKGYSSTTPIQISEGIPREAVAEFSEQGDKFPGLNIAVEPVRTYTSESLASHILGYTGKINESEYQTRKDTYSNNDVIGKTGIEYVFEEYLKGTNGTKQIDMDINGATTGEYVVKEAKSGADVVLTIDANLQQITEKALASNIEKIRNGGFGKVYNAKGGCCVVMNVNTGEVISMASYPDYNPGLFVNGISTQDWNNYNNNPLHPLVDKATQISYSPGSTFKMVTAIAGLESGAVTLTERINDTGVYKKYGIQMNCWYYTDYHVGHGLLNVSDAIKHSCNYYFYETGDRMGIDTLVKYSKYFGLGGKTGIELPSETSGVLASKETAARYGNSWNPGDTLNSAIGQGYNEFTPLQMAKYISILCNGGEHIDVNVVSSVKKSDGSEVNKAEVNAFVNSKLGLQDEVVENLDIKQENIDSILEGMRSVTSESGGTAYNIFKNFNIEVGGKTGSAEAGNDVNAWFVGFAPFENPEIAIVVVVENGGHGNYTAEAVRDIMAEYFGMNVQKVEENMKAIPYTEIIR